MRQRVERTGWWIRRLRGRRFAWFVAVIVAAGAAAWVYRGSDTAAMVGSVVITFVLLVSGMALSRPLRALSSRLFLRSVPWRGLDGPIPFAGATLGFRAAGLGGGRSPREEVDAVTRSGARFSTGEVTLELWVVAADGQGRDWVIVQEAREFSGGRIRWTSSVEGELTIADFDATGRPNPFRAAHRLAKEDLDAPLVDIQLLGWGTEEGDRDTIVAFARTSVGTEQLSGVDYAGEPPMRWAHRVRLDLDGVAKALGWGHPADWRGGAAFGLLELLEISQPGSWAELERRVAPRWHEKNMFARVERGTRRISERPGIA